MASKLILGLELIGANPSGIDKLKKEAQSEGMHTVYQIGKGQERRIVLSPLNENCGELIDACVDEIGEEDALINVVVINQSDDSVHEANAILEGMRESDEFEEDAELSLAMIYDVCDFVESHPDLVNADLNDSEEKLNDETGEVPAEENNDQDGDTDLDKDGNLDDDTELGDGEINDSENLDNDSIDNIFEEIEEDSINNDPIYQKAVQIVNDHIRFNLPKFDEFTQLQLQPEIVELENGVAAQKDMLIQQVYDKLCESKDDTEAYVETANIIPAQQDHENVVEKLKTAHDLELNNKKQLAIDEYNHNKDEYVRTVIPRIKEKYDAKFLDHHHEYLNMITRSVDADYLKKKQDAQQKLDDFVEGAKSKAVNDAWNHVDVSDDVDEFNKYVQEQLQKLQEKAKEFDDQVENVTANLRNEVAEAKSKQAEAEKAKSLLKDTMEQQVNAKVAEKISDTKLATQNEVDQVRSRYNLLDQKHRELRDQRDKLQKELDAEKSKFAEQFTELNDQVKEAKARVEQVGHESKAAEPKKSFLKKLNEFAGIAALFIAMIFGAFWFGTSVVGGQQQDVPTVTELSPSTTSQSSDESSKGSSFKKGETFDYKTSDGKDVQVIVDSTHAGHYIDKNGKIHSVVF